MFLHQLISKKNVIFLLSKTVFRRRSCFLSSVTADDKDGHGLKLDKIWAGFLSFNAAIPANVLSALCLISSS